MIIVCNAIQLTQSCVCLRHYVIIIIIINIIAQNINQVLSEVEEIKAQLRSVAVNTTLIKNDFLQLLSNGGDLCLVNASANSTTGVADLVETLQDCVS